MFFDFTAILIVNVRACGIFTKYGDVKKRSQGHTSRAKIVQAAPSLAQRRYDMYDVIHVRNANSTEKYRGVAEFIA